MIGTTEIYETLIADTTVKGLVTSSGVDPNKKYNIAVAVREPDNWLISQTSITVYQSGVDLIGEYYDVAHTVNCRAPIESSSKALARAVISVLHRVRRTDSMLYCELLQTIPPADNTDSFNTPVTVRVKGRN